MNCPRKRLYAENAIHYLSQQAKAERLNREAIAAHKMGLTWPIKALPFIPKGAFLTYLQSRPAL